MAEGIVKNNNRLHEILSGIYLSDKCNFLLYIKFSFKILLPFPIRIRYGKNKSISRIFWVTCRTGVNLFYQNWF